MFGASHAYVSERVSHYGFLGQASYDPDRDSWTVVWRPTDPMWRKSLMETDVEAVTGRLYPDAVDRWHEAVEVWIDGQEGRANGTSD